MGKSTISMAIFDSYVKLPGKSCEYMAERLFYSCWYLPLLQRPAGLGIASPDVGQ